MSERITQAPRYTFFDIMRQLSEHPAIAQDFKLLTTAEDVRIFRKADFSCGNCGGFEIDWSGTLTVFIRDSRNTNIIYFCEDQLNAIMDAINKIPNCEEIKKFEPKGAFS